jgi:hypothetical protein
MSTVVSERRARTTGTTVVVYRDDAEECGTGLRWVTLCDDHGHLVGHETRELAVAHGPHPDQWCVRCMGLVDDDGQTVR